MSTPEGRANYFLTLAQIARACQVSVGTPRIFIFFNAVAFLGDHSFWSRLCILDMPKLHQAMAREAWILSQGYPQTIVATSKLHVGNCCQD